MLLQDFEPKFRSHQQDETIFKELSAQAKRMAHRDDTGAAVVELLVQLLAEAACNDPTAVLLSEVMLPVCRERLEAAAGFKVSTNTLPQGCLSGSTFALPDNNNNNKYITIYIHVHNNTFQ